MKGEARLDDEIEIEGVTAMATVVMASDTDPEEEEREMAMLVLWDDTEQVRCCRICKKLARCWG